MAERNQIQRSSCIQCGWVKGSSDTKPYHECPSCGFSFVKDAYDAKFEIQKRKWALRDSSHSRRFERKNTRNYRYHLALAPIVGLIGIIIITFLECADSKTRDGNEIALYLAFYGILMIWCVIEAKNIKKIYRVHKRYWRRYLTNKSK